MYEFRSGSSKAVNTRKAAQECLDAAGVDSERSPGFLLVHTTLGHRFDEMLDELRQRAPGATIAGCTGSGVISAGGFVSEAMRAMAVMAVYDAAVEVASVDSINGDNSAELSERCARELYGSAPQPARCCKAPAMRVPRCAASPLLMLPQKIPQDVGYRLRVLQMHVMPALHIVNLQLR